MLVKRYTRTVQPRNPTCVEPVPIHSLANWQNSGGVEMFSNLPNLQERLQKQRRKLHAYLPDLCGL